jgi:hypothetical protein
MKSFSQPYLDKLVSAISMTQLRFSEKSGRILHDCNYTWEILNIPKNFMSTLGLPRRSQRKSSGVCQNRLISVYNVMSNIIILHMKYCTNLFFLPFWHEIYVVICPWLHLTRTISSQDFSLSSCSKRPVLNCNRVYNPCWLGLINWEVICKYELSLYISQLLANEITSPLSS